MLSQATSAQPQAEEKTKVYLGARVKWPPECPDDILDDAINETHNAISMFDTVKEGKQVINFLLFLIHILNSFL